MTIKADVVGDWEAQYVTLWGQPCVASRPRVSRWGTYHAPKYKNWKAAAEKAIPRQSAHFKEPAHVFVELVFYVERAKSSKLLRPSGDIDNYDKAILDVLTNRGFWKDDVDIIKCDSTKVFIPHGSQPRTTVAIRRFDAIEIATVPYIDQITESL